MSAENTITAIQVYETLPAKIATIPKAFELNRDIIQKAVNEVKDYTITGIDDKAGVENVTRAAKILKKMRTTVENNRKSEKDDAIKYGRAVDAYAKELTDIIVPVEKEANTKLIAWEAQVKAEEMKREQEEMEILQFRVTSLLELGAKFDGVNYKLENEVISHSELKLISLEEYCNVAVKFEEVACQLQVEKEKQAAVEREEAAAKQAAFEAEKLALAEQQAANEKLAAELEEQRERNEQMAEETRQQQARLIEQRTSVRIMQLEALNMYRHGIEMVLTSTADNPAVISIANIESLSSDLWDLFYKNTVENIAAYKTLIEQKEAESKALQQRTAAREKQLHELGMTLDFGSGQWYFKTNDFGKTFIPRQEILILEEDTWPNIFDCTNGEIANLKQKQAAFDLQQAQEAERQRKEHEAKDEQERQAQLTADQIEAEAYGRDCVKALPWMKEIISVFQNEPVWESKEMQQQYEEFKSLIPEMQEMAIEMETILN